MHSNAGHLNNRPVHDMVLLLLPSGGNRNYTGLLAVLASVDCCYLQLARSFCSQLGGVVLFCLFGISFAIVPDVSITLVMHLMSCDFWEMLLECTLGSYKVLHFYQHKIYNYNTCVMTDNIMSNSHPGENIN